MKPHARTMSITLIALISIGLGACGGETAGTSTTDSGPVAPVVETASVDAHPGEAPYQARCAQCHDQAVYKAPGRLFLAMLGPRNVFEAMDGGLMSAQAEGLSRDQKLAVAEYLTGQSLADMSEPPSPPACGDESVFDSQLAPTSLGWGVNQANHRFHPAAGGGLVREDMERLEVKWAFAFPNAIKARSQPAYGGGAIYFGSQDGTVHALDAKTGCQRWTFKAGGEVRNAIVITPWAPGELEATPTLYFADIVARVYAVDARTGELRWSVKSADHPFATVTAAVALHEGLVYVPISSLEVAVAGDPSYACCTFRGAVLALNAATGEEVWRTHTIEEVAAVVGQTRAGTDILAPSGAPVWNTPTIDPARGLLYVGTGENYSSPSDGNSDAIIALDLATGARAWVSQQTAGDAWNAGCLVLYTDDDSNCPEENGPDYDFAASAMLFDLPGGEQVLLGGQKSGWVMALDPDDGSLLWRTQVGRGGVQGGVHFGMAADGTTAFIPINDMRYPEDSTRYKYTSEPRPGLYALEVTTGVITWSAPADDRCGDMAGCDPGISQAVTAVPGAVIAGYLDGMLRVHDNRDGRVLWSLDTLREFETVSGVAARGGSFSGGGALVADGMVYVNSGYGIYEHMAGNVLLALGPKDKE